MELGDTSRDPGEESPARPGYIKVGLGAEHLLPPPQQSHSEPTHGLRTSVTIINRRIFPLLEGMLGPTTSNSLPTSPSPETFLWFSTWQIKEWVGSQVTWEAGAQLCGEAQSRDTQLLKAQLQRKSSTHFLLGEKEKERLPALITADGKLPESPLWEAN